MAIHGPDWGEINFGRFQLVETGVVSEQSDGTVSLQGQESSPPATVEECLVLHEQVLGLQTGHIYAVQFRDDATRNGYYQVESTTAEMTNYQSEVVTSNWTTSLTRLGSDKEVDLQSRLTATVRTNDFALSGERWHGPAIGHYAYWTGTTNPTSMTRTGAEGAMTVYRGVPANVSPRWGCDVADYNTGRVRITDTQLVPMGAEVEGTNMELGTLSWSLSNALVNVAPTSTAGVVDVQTYSGSSFHSKRWKVTVAGTPPTWNSATVLRNDPEMCVIRLVASQSPGRAALDLTLRRGSRVVEGYLQSSSSATHVVALVTAETNVNTAASGYLTKTSDDADGNRFVCGSARTFTGSTNGTMTKSSTTFLDFFLGAVVGGGSAVSGDAAVDLRNQYIGSMAESTYIVRR
ncbi:hypothetical protein [Streptomyces sp. NPDC088847]|uniref:hypothetical protein n=1 Tax=Streptomyces sp. NPDC088847 TaxID=3365909 RepID=UPI0037FE7C95